MDHTQTIDDQTVERYLLGELQADEAEDFERHYFECPECALAVESGQVFIENARQVFTEDVRSLALDPQPERRPKRFRNIFEEFWSRPAFALPSVAAVLFGAIVVYQGAVLIPDIRQSAEVAQAPPAFQLVGATRGESVRVAVPAGTPFILEADIPSGKSYQRYRCILTADGRTVLTVDALPPAEGQPINIVVRTKDLKPGKFELGIYGLEPDGRQSDIISTNPFEFQFN
jgi:hypothetical protein